MKHLVFISHSSAEVSLAQKVCNELESAGLKCWIAPRDIVPGEIYAKSLLDAINHSKLMLLIFSANSNKSVQVQKEIDRAVNARITIIPFRIDETIPSAAMEYYLCNTHWLNAYSGNLEDHIQELISIAKTVLQQKAETKSSDDVSDNTIIRPFKLSKLELKKLEAKNKKKAKTFSKTFRSKQLKYGIAAAVFVILCVVIVAGYTFFTSNVSDEPAVIAVKHVESKPAKPVAKITPKPVAKIIPKPVIKPLAKPRVALPPQMTSTTYGGNLANNSLYELEKLKENILLRSGLLFNKTNRAMTYYEEREKLLNAMNKKQITFPEYNQLSKIDSVLNYRLFKKNRNNARNIKLRDFFLFDIIYSSGGTKVDLLAFELLLMLERGLLKGYHRPSLKLITSLNEPILQQDRLNRAKQMGATILFKVKVERSSVPYYKISYSGQRAQKMVWLLERQLSKDVKEIFSEKKNFEKIKLTPIPEVVLEIGFAKSDIYSSVNNINLDIIIKLEEAILESFKKYYGGSL